MQKWFKFFFALCHWSCVGDKWAKLQSPDINHLPDKSLLQHAAFLKGSRAASVAPGMQSLGFDTTFVSTATNWEITIDDINYIGRIAMTNNSSLQIKTQKGMKNKFHSICMDMH